MVGGRGGERRFPARSIAGPIQARPRAIVREPRIMTKECPMCTEIMRPFTVERVDTIPGTMQTVRRTCREWRCPECDYFEDVELDELEAGA
jgi:hypothetical protein